MTELSREQQEALDAGSDPLRLVDPRTGKTYVLLGADRYERIQSLLADDPGLDRRQVAILVERAMREEDVGDPTLEFYQQTYGRKS